MNYFSGKKLFVRTYVFIVCWFFWATPTLGQGPATGHIDPKNIPLEQKANFFLFRKQPEKALELFKKQLLEQPENSYAARGIVRSFKAMEKLDESDKFFKELLITNPNSSSGLYGLGFTAYLREKNAEAKSHLARSIEVDSSNGLARNTLGAVFIRLKEAEKAVEQIKQAIKINPSELIFIRNLSHIYGQLGKPEKFTEEYREHLRLGNQTLAKGYGKIYAEKLRQESFRLYVKGDIQGTIDKNINMIKIYREISHLPGEVSGLFSLGVLYEEKKEFHKAEEYFQKVLKLSPQHIQAREKLQKLKKNSFIK